MIDERRTGLRCIARRRIRVIGKTRDVERGEWGVIRYETDNEGRRLILVAWDGGELIHVFEDEVDVLWGSNAEV